MLKEDRKHETEGRIGKPGKQGNRVQVSRITGSQDAGYQQTTESRYGLTCSTIVENPLQIAPLFCKTKPICRRCKIQVSSLLTEDYEEEHALRANRSKAKQSQFQKCLCTKTKYLYTGPEGVG